MQRGNFPFALVLMPFNLLLQPRTAWHENCEAEILACLSPHLGRRSACLLQAGVRVTRHETRITVFSRFAMGAQEWRHQKPPPGLPRRPVTAFLCAIGRLWSGMSGKLPLSRCPHIFRRSRSVSRRAPFATAAVALPEFFEEHAESLELWSPGYPLFTPRGS